MIQTTPARPPPRERLRQGKFIVVGSVESLAGQRELRCVLHPGRAEVSVYIDDKPTGPSLSYAAPSLRAGDRIDEGEFTDVLDAYTINSPWHDGEYNCLVRTIDCLRKNQQDLLLTFKDL